jgi:uncharacterized YigZ family protein
MPAPTRYPIPARQHRAEHEVSRSRFIATIGPAATSEQASEFVRAVRGEYADATHNAWAFVAGPPGDTNQVGANDDGEVRGTAGRPMLTELLHSGIGNIVAVVSRYYGGTQLGTGGLVRAYGGSVQLALATLPLAERVERVTVMITISYAAIDSLRLLLAAHEAELTSETYGEDVRYEIRLPVSSVDALRALLMDATRGQATMTEPIA